MDFWSRLIGGATKQKHQSSAANTPQQRLQRFRRAYAPILQLCSRPQVTAADGQALKQLRISLQQIAALLREESRTPAPHLCLNFAASAQIYSVIARAASTSQNEAVIREAITVFSILVDSEEEDFMASTVFARSLIRFTLRVTATASIGDDSETDLIEVLFGVAAKLRVQPVILPVWFRATSRPQQDESVERDKKDFAGTTQKDDFPLCYLLIDRIHHEGRIGDFARTGLLYVFEAVSYSPELEDWIIGSDLPTLMASGLGALYSQLSRELSLRHQNEHLPLMLAMSDYADLPQSMPGAENIFSATHANHVSTFLSHLAFWQDCLEHCKSEDVKQTLLDHFRVLFLQQLLYPSLLQSSDTDGGSSVAVLTYIANTLEALDHPDLVRMILHYLLAMPDPTSATSSRSPMASRRQSSLMLLDGLSSDEEKVDPNLFSLVDLILNGVRSRNPQTAVAALKLSSVLLNRHTNYAVSTLVKAEAPLTRPIMRTAGALSVETDQLMRIAASLSYRESLDDAYVTALQDVLPSLEVQFVQKMDVTTAQPQPQPPALQLQANDPFMAALSSLFKSFFTNSVDVNLALTEAVMQMALRTQISLEGWLAAPPSSYSFADEARTDLTADPEYLDEEEILAFQAMRQANRRPDWDYEHVPILPCLLRQLKSEIDSIRGSISNIDALIAKRIEILSGIEKDEPMTRPGSRAPSRMSSDAGGERARSRKPGDSSQIQRLKSESAASTRVHSPIRSATPSRVRDLSAPTSRGAESPGRLSPRASSGRLNHGIFQPPPPELDSDQLVAVTKSARDPFSTVYEHEAETLRRRLVFSGRIDDPAGVLRHVPEGSQHQQANNDHEQRSVSTSHVLTNIVILHFFILELVAVLQTRAVMFDEVAYS